jgi:hypothetical protein
MSLTTTLIRTATGLVAALAATAACAHPGHGAETLHPHAEWIVPALLVAAAAAVWLIKRR